MGEYDAVWVFLISAIFVGFYIFIEARPKGSSVIKDVTGTISRFFRKRSICLLITNIQFMVLVFVLCS